VTPGRPGGPGGPAGAADTAGVPWTGRELPQQPFADDDGAADPRLEAALAVGSPADVVAALAPARLLVPVVAVLGEDHPVPTHARGDLGADMAMVTLTGADGRRALPVFTCLATLARWNPAARPVPVATARAALAAVAEGCDHLVLDAAGPVTDVVPRPAVRALGQGLAWTPPADDEELLAALVAAVRAVPQVQALRAEAVGDAGLRVLLGITPGLSREALAAVVDAVRAGLAGVELLAERVDALHLTVLPAWSPPRSAEG